MNQKNKQSTIDDDVRINNFDLFTGLIGKGVYFLERNNSDSNEKLITITNKIISLASEDEYGLCWKDFESIRFSDVIKNEVKVGSEYLFNLGLAHGIPSVISFLSLVHCRGVNQKVIGKSIRKACDWIIHFRKESESRSYNHFLDSTYSPVLANKSSMAWCYGDLSVSVALLQAFQALVQEDLLDNALKIASKAAKRKLEDSEILVNKKLNLLNIGFCHGTSGVAHIFNRLFQATNNSVFQNSSNYWFEIGNEFRQSDDIGIAGFVSYELDPEPTVFDNDISLLDGASGVGLSLMSRFYDSKFKWDSVFLTNLHG